MAKHQLSRRREDGDLVSSRRWCLQRCALESVGCCIPVPLQETWAILAEWHSPRLGLHCPSAIIDPMTLGHFLDYPTYENLQRWQCLTGVWGGVHQVPTSSPHEFVIIVTRIMHGT